MNNVETFNHCFFQLSSLYYFQAFYLNNINGIPLSIVYITNPILILVMVCNLLIKLPTSLQARTLHPFPSTFFSSTFPSSYFDPPRFHYWTDVCTPSGTWLRSLVSRLDTPTLHSPCLLLRLWAGTPSGRLILILILYTKTTFTRRTTPPISLISQVIHKLGEYILFTVHHLVNFTMSPNTNVP